MTRTIVPKEITHATRAALRHSRHSLAKISEVTGIKASTLSNIRNDRQRSSRHADQLENFLEVKPPTSISIMDRTIDAEILAAGHLAALSVRKMEGLLKMMRNVSDATLDGDLRASSDLATDLEPAIQEVHKIAKRTCDELCRLAERKVSNGG